MRTLRFVRRIAAFTALAVSAVLWHGCSDQAPDLLTDPSVQQTGRPDPQAVRVAITAQARHNEALLRIPGVVGTAVGLLPSGRLGVRVFLARPGVQGVPADIEGIPVATEVTGMLMALSDPTTRERPAPVGYSIGHYAITAGTIGARVVDGSGNVYVLSNNHVLANSNDAQIGDPAYQPGPFDGGTAADQVATLAAFRPIDFTGGANTMDAALALTTTSEVGSATPTDDAYGAPSATIYGDGDGDGFFDDPTALLGLPVQKYGRTTGLTTGQITGVNATLTICYEVLYIFCIKPATFVDQLVIDAAGFSGGGDSGSLIVTADGTNRLVALLFAGSETQTIANRIDLVLDHFGVAVDTTGSPPPAPVTDVAVTGVSTVASVQQGDTAAVNVTIRNAGNQPVDSTFTVTLTDTTDGVVIGTQSVTGLGVGATSALTFSWATSASSVGTHTLTASHDFADGNAANNQRSTTVTVNGPLWDLAVTSVNANSPVIQGNTAGVNVTLKNVGNQPVGAFTVTLVDATDSVTVGTKSVASLAVGATTMVTINWNTATSSIGVHTLVGSHDFPDDNAANDQGTKLVTVDPPGGPAPLLDVGIPSVSTVASVQRGDTAGVNVTLQNLGNQAAGAFTVTLTDVTDGATVGTQSVAGLAVGTTTTVTIPWHTATSSIGTHTLTASHDLADGNVGNNQRSTTVSVTDPAGPPPVNDIAVTSVNANSPVIQGNTAGVNVTLKNVGNQPVGAFTVTLVDATDSVTVGTKSVASLAVGATTMVTINWNTATSSIGVHTLVGSHDFPDDNAANDQGTKLVTVDPPGGPAPLLDVGIPSVSTVASVQRGDTAGVNVTLQNLGNQAAGAFTVTLTDVTDGATVGTQSVAGLALGTTTTVTIPWHTATSSIGTHTLTASHDLADGNAGNNQRSTTVSVTDPAGPPPVNDIAVTSVTAPATLVRGNTAGVNVTLKNVGNQPVGAFTVTLVDATDSVTVGTKSVASLAVGATTMVTINWNTATSSIGVHTLVGSHDFPDDNAANDQGTKVVTVTDPADDIHIGDLDGSASNGGKTWTATVVITVHAMDHTPVSGALVTGSWSALGLNVNQCTTGSDGTCAVVFPDLKKNRSSVTYSVTGVTLAGRPYKPAQNHDLDGSSNGYSITVRKP